MQSVTAPVRWLLGVLGGLIIGLTICFAVVVIYWPLSVSPTSDTAGIASRVFLSLVFVIVAAMITAVVVGMPLLRATYPRTLVGFLAGVGSPLFLAPIPSLAIGHVFYQQGIALSGVAPGWLLAAVGLGFLVLSGVLRQSRDKLLENARKE